MTDTKINELAELLYRQQCPGGSWAKALESTQEWYRSAVRLVLEQAVVEQREEHEVECVRCGWRGMLSQVRFENEVAICPKTCACVVRPIEDEPERCEECGTANSIIEEQSRRLVDLKGEAERLRTYGESLTKDLKELVEKLKAQSNLAFRDNSFSESYAISENAHAINAILDAAERSRT